MWYPFICTLSSPGQRRDGGTHTKIYKLGQELGESKKTKQIARFKKIAFDLIKLRNASALKGFIGPMVFTMNKAFFYFGRHPD